MRFLDTNVFVYAYYKPRRRLTPKEEQMKEYAKKIITEVSEGREQVAMTVVHLSEIVNILKHGLPMDQLNKVIHGLFMLDNVTIMGVSRDAYFAAIELGEDLMLEANDALAIDVMRQNDLKEVYSFDEDFEKLEGITRIPRLSAIHS
ncbi:type II toxin-antitoxin system VapC family toxin [Candidatus Bathyarchaeota archaeon]|nr:type II toxin-antitoxin system VapC family toxin [Candidatus Bathyarchaeota archaeon]